MKRNKSVYGTVATMNWRWLLRELSTSGADRADLNLMGEIFGFPENSSISLFHGSSAEGEVEATMKTDATRVTRTSRCSE